MYKSNMRLFKEGMIERGYEMLGIGSIITGVLLGAARPFGDGLYLELKHNVNYKSAV
jgi:hypothetical protein